MTEDNPFYRLKAAARQQQLSLGLHDAAAVPQPAHPATALLTGTQQSAVPRGVVVGDAPPAQSAAEAKQRPATPAEDVDVVIEPAPDGSAAPWWAAKSPTLARGAFYPPVPVTIPRQGHSPPANDGGDGLASLVRSPHKARKASLIARLSLACSRPRALLALLSVVAIGIVGMNAVANYRSSSVAQAEQRARAAALGNSLALLDPSGAAIPVISPTRNSQRASGTTTALAATAAAGDPPDLSADSIEDYVRKAMPRLSGEQPAPGGQGKTPREVQARPLPAVAAPSAAAAGAVLPKKAPVGEYLDQPTPAPKSPGERKQRPGRQAKAESPRAANAASSPANADPLSHVLIRAVVVNPNAPFRVHEIREQRHTLGAYVLPRRAKDLGEGVWVNAGHVFANGWELVGVERKQAVFLSPEGEAVRVQPAPVE